MSSLWDLFSENAFSDDDGPAAFRNPIASFESEAPSGNGDPLEQDAPAARFFNEKLIFWALRNLPATEAVKHFLICGVTGSGKTTAIKLFLQSIAPRFKCGSSHAEQLIIFDAKCDALPQLAAYGLRPEDENVWIINPFDERGAVWNIAEAFQSPAMARYFASLIIPEDKNGSENRFWIDAPREVVVAVITALSHHRKTHWTFRDFLCAISSEANIMGVCARHEGAKAKIKQMVTDDKHFPGILTTVASRLGKFESVAALWHTAPSRKSFDLDEFLKKPGVLVLGFDPVFKDCMWPINALLLRALTNQILRGPNTDRPRHWFVLDEFPAMEKVEAIHDLLNRGRSKGASVLLGFQSTEGLVKIHDKPTANDIMGQCANKTFLRLGDPESAEWAERFFGKVRTTSWTVGESWDGDGKRSHSRSSTTHDTPLFLASTFGALPLPRRGENFCCISDVPFLDCALLGQRPFDQLVSWLVPPSKDVPAILRRDNVTEETLWPWNPEEAWDIGGQHPDTDASETEKSCLPAPVPPPRD